jgi:hypothetical protein
MITVASVSWTLKMTAIFFRYFLRIVLFSVFTVPAMAECFRDLDPVFEQGRDYFGRGQYLLSTQQLSMYSLLSCDSEKQDRGRLRWAQALFELGETQEGNLILDKISAKSPSSSKAKIIRAWYQPSLVPTLSESEQKRFVEWNEQIHSLPEPKNPWVAGSLSAVVPGLGQVYNGNYQSGLFSLALNALFFGATHELARKHMDSTAWAAGVVFSVVYVGNIVGSAQSANAINANSQEPAKLDLKNKIFPELSF